MKKIISVILSAIMIFSMFCFGASAENEELIITVVNDLHYNTTYTNRIIETNKLNADFYHVGTSTRLPNEAYAIILAFLEDAAENDSQFVIIPGDITDHGTDDEISVMTGLFREFEKNTGKQIYVVPGNHDYFNSSVEKFKADYAEFGYNEAVEVDDSTASYIVDLPGDYRLLAIDSCAPGESRHGIDEARLQWIANQGEKAKADGKKLIAMHHHNLLEHMVFSALIQPNGVVSAKVQNAADVYADAGIRYIFTGHTHDHDIASYKSANGAVIYDAVTGSLNALGSLYRVVSFGEKVKFETKGVDSIDVTLLPEGITENALAIAESNFFEYQTIATNLSYEIVFNNYTTAAGLKSFLKLEDDEMNAIIDKVGNRLNEALNMPLLKKNEAEEGKSIEALAEKYNVSVPATDYKNIIDIAVTIFQAHNMGDENFPAYSDEVIILTRGLAAALNYALSEVTGEEYAKVLTVVADLLGVNMSVNFINFAGNNINRFEGVEILITTAALPLIAEFATDNAPADCNVTLPGYEEAPEKEVTLLDRFIDFLKMVYNAFRTFFALFF